jgi:hypothetical protein
MAEEFTLNINRDKQGHPMSAQCSCGAEMDRGAPRTYSAKEQLEKWFEGQFESHKRTAHRDQSSDRG